MRLNEVNCLLSVSTSYRALIHGELDDFFVLHQWCLPLGQRRLGIIPEKIHPLPATLRLSFVIRMVHVIGVGDSQVRIETI